MSYQSDMVGILRVYIDDLCTPYRFDDKRLLSVLMVAGRNVLRDGQSSFTFNYNIDITNQTISPDPSADFAFVDLTVLKAGCLIDHTEARRAAKNAGFTVNEFASKIDTKGLADARFKIIEVGMCKTYEDSMFTYLTSQNTASGLAILSPFRTYYTTYNSPVYRR